MPLKDKVEGNELDLSLNQLIDVPVKELAAASKATHLDLSCNQIQSLPNDFATLTHLVKIDLSRNKLTELPHNFGNLTNLQYLDLDKNELRNVPLSFCRLKNLRWLDLKDNPLEPKLKEIAGDCLDEKQCQVCAKKVVAYMQSIDSNLEREKQKKLKEIREKEALEKEKMEKELEEHRRFKKLQKERKRAESKAKREGNVQNKEEESCVQEVGIADSLITENRRDWHWCTWVLLLLCFVVAITIVILTTTKVPFLHLTSLNLKSFQVHFTKLNKIIIQLWNSKIIPGALYIKASILRNIHSIMLYISEMSYDIEILLSNYI